MATKNKFRKATNYAGSGKTHTKAPAPAAVPTTTELRSRSEAPKPVATHTHTANDEKRREVAKAEAKERAKQVDKNEKAEAAAKVKADVLAGRTVSETRLHGCTATQLHDICKHYGRGKTARFVGHSGLKKDDLVAYMASADRPPVEKKAPNAGTMGYYLDILRSRNGGKGYTASDTALSKKRFDGKSISALKAEQVKALCKELGLS